MRWFGWFRNQQGKQEDVLTPGTCECSHPRCSHADGRWRCSGAFPIDAEWPNGARCACQIFIRDKGYDNGGDDTPEPPTDPAIKELEKIYKSPCS